MAALRKVQLTVLLQAWSNFYYPRGVDIQGWILAFGDTAILDISSNMGKSIVK